jgi:hypothetical protein
MKKLQTAALALGALILPASFAFAQDYPNASINPPYTYAPGAADAPMHGTHDKARAVREDNNNGVFAGAANPDRSAYEGYYRAR